MQFSLKINLGNSSMLTALDVARALRTVADQIERGFSARAIADENGNPVGQYKTIDETGRITELP